MEAQVATSVPLYQAQLLHILIMLVKVEAQAQPVYQPVYLVHPVGEVDQVLLS